MFLKSKRLQFQISGEVIVVSNLTSWTRKFTRLVTLAKKKKNLFLGRKTLTKYYIAEVSEVRIVKSHGFPNCNIWLWKLPHTKCYLKSWIKLFSVSWTARRTNPPVLNKEKPACLLESKTMKLRFKYFGHIMQKKGSYRSSCCLETLKAIEKKLTKKGSCMLTFITQTWVYKTSVLELSQPILVNWYPLVRKSQRWLIDWITRNVLKET